MPQGDLENFFHMLDCLPVAAMLILVAEDQKATLGQQQIIYANAKYHQLIGYPLSETPTSEAWMEVAYPDRQHREKLLSLCHTFGAGLQEDEDIVSARIRIRCRDGQQRDFQVIGESRSVIPDHYLVIFQDLTNLTAEIEELKQQSEVDQLTGVFNQHYLIRRLDNEIVRAGHSGVGFTLMMLDLDFFKEINDHYGHHCGDQVLMSTVDIISEVLSSVDCLSRWNGADFIVLMRENNSGIARQIIQKAWQQIRAHTFSWEESTFAMTMTIGLTAYRAGDTTESILERVDQALKRGKRVGGDFIFVDDSV